MNHEVIRVDLEQGTPEWLAWRRKRAMASETAAVMGLSPFQSPEQIRAAKRGTDKTYVTAAMQRGHDEEPIARQVYEDAVGEFFQPACFERGTYGASVDGISMDGERLLEIKSPAKGRDSDLWALVADSRLSDHYELQVQHQLMVTGASQCYFMVWSGEPNSDQPYVGVRVTPDPNIWEEIQQAWDDFWPTVAAREDDEWREAAQAYREAKKNADIAAQALSEAKARLLECAGGPYANGCGVRVQEIQRKGSIDWKRVQKDQLGDVDLEKYRKPGTAFYQVEVTEE